MIDPKIIEQIRDNATYHATCCKRISVSVAHVDALLAHIAAQNKALRQCGHIATRIVYNDSTFKGQHHGGQPSSPRRG
jgi:hypothetical protein